MTKVNIAQFKAHLGRYLGLVRRGRSLVVADRGTPVATVVPYSEARPSRLETRKPSKPARDLGRLQFPPVRGPQVDSVKLLREERRDRR